ncbi:hypothetical protein LguiA_035494 [Lonicera macranthoides]
MAAIAALQSSFTSLSFLQILLWPKAKEARPFSRRFHADYYENIEQYPVLSQVQPGYLRRSQPELAPANPESIETILEDIKKHVIPGVTH